MEVQTARGIAKLKNREQFLGVLSALIVTDKLDMINDIPETDLKEIETRIEKSKDFKYLAHLKEGDAIVIFGFTDPSFLSGIASAIVWFNLPQDLLTGVTDSNGTVQKVIF